MDTVIMIDTCSDLKMEYVRENHIPFLSLTVNFKGKEIIDDFWQTLNAKYFYNSIRNGENLTTSQVNVYTYIEEFNKHIKEGKAIIYISFSSALSGSYNNAKTAKESILEEHRDADITVIDSKCASMGEGLLVYYAIEMLKEGASKKKIVDWIEKNKLKINHLFTVDDLHHLKRGGRVSNTAAFVGTLLHIKPILIVDNEGRLIPIKKERGRKKSIKELAEMLSQKVIAPEEQVIFISHGDCYDDAKYLAELIQEKHKVKEIVINNVGPVIGAHSGPGTVALFFLGNNREDV